MTYLLTLHHQAPLTVATTDPLVPPEQIAPLQDALALAGQLSDLLAGQQAARDQAEAQGYAAGEAAGHAAGQARALQDAAQALAEQMQRIAAEQAGQREELRQALVALAGGMVRRMASELAPAQVLAALAERAFEHVVPPQPVRLRLPPALLEPVRAQLAQRELALPVHCSADDALHGLQCVVESAAGTLLAGLDDVLARTTQSLETSLRTQAAADGDPATEAAPPADRVLP
jgi:flagellar assembly protein FliH